MSSESDPIAAETTENDIVVTAAAMNLGSKFDKVAAPEYAGGKHIWRNLINGPTTAWTNIEADIKTDLTAFVLDDLWAEHSNSVHNLAAKGKTLRGLSAGAHLTADGWKALFQESYAETTPLSLSIDGEKVRRFGIRLALTDPDSIFVGDAVWRQGGLVDRMDTCAWVGAYMLFGAPWKNADTWPTKSRFNTKVSADATMQDSDDEDGVEIVTPPPKDSNSNNTSVTSATSSQKPKKKVGWTRQMFLSKPLAQAKVVPTAASNKKKKHKRKHMTYMKIKTARLISSTTFEQEQEYVTMLHEALNKMWQVDSDMLVYHWDDINAPPLTKNSTLPTNKNSASTYVNGAFLRQGQAAWIRLHVGHNKSVDSFEDPTVKEWFRDKDMNLYKETLQAKVTCKAGWLLGSNGLCLNPRDLEEAFGLIPELQGIPIEVRIEVIRIAKGKGTEVKAAHILTPWDKALKCRIAMNMVYGKKSANGYPLGKNMRFIPNILDTRFIVTEKTKMKVKKSVSKQKYFLQKTQSATSYTIIALDYVDPHVGMSLREILMGLRSNKEPEKNLFLNVDVHMYKQTVTLLFHNDLAQEAMTAIPALPVILEAKFGPRIWAWFSEEAKEHAIGYYWDSRTGLKSTDDDRLGEMLGDWGADWGSDDDDDRSVSTASTTGRMEPFRIVTDSTGKNQYYDDGSSVGTFKSTCAKVNPGNHDFQDAITIESPAASTLSTDNWEADLQKKMTDDPAFKAYILKMAGNTGGIPKPSAPDKAAEESSGEGE